jgi:hypothetical protein
MTDYSEYCRLLETYLCQKNGGHLIRIVGPSFEQVCGWADRGVPLKIAFRGIDRCCERLRARRARRRPVRIEFCEADILELFDDWRRAVGVAATPEEEITAQRRRSLASHIERVVPRLLAARGGGRSPVLSSAIDAAVREMDGLMADARAARGEPRSRILARLQALDRELLAIAETSVDAARAAELRREAETELEPFSSRMTPESRQRALGLAYHRLVRETLRLPVIAFDS